MLSRGKDLPETIRGSILALFLFADLSYEKICSSLKVPSSTVRTICEKVKVSLH